MAIGKISSSGVIIGGMIGQKGAMGKTGPIGKTPHLTIGKVETVEEIEQANVTITGTDENPVFNILLPRGEKGETGKTGLTPKIEIGTVSTLNSDENAIVNISGTKEELVLDIGIPRGKKGDNYVLQESDKQEIINDITFNANSEFNLTVNTKTEEFNVNASTKTKEFNDNATTKNNTFNTNAQSKQEEYDTNAQSKQESYDTNASKKIEEYNENAKKSKESFDTNVTTKTTEFNDNVTQKTSDFNQNVTSKTDEFNSNANVKTGEFNTNAEQKTNEFNENASGLQEQFSKVVEENEQLNKTISNLPKIKEQTGTDLTLENTSVGYFYHENKKGMRLAGNIEQETTQGKQLYNYKDIELKTGVTVDEDGWITATYDNTNGTKGYYFNYSAIKNNLLNVSQQYAVILEIKNFTGTGVLAVDRWGQFKAQWSISSSNMSPNTIYVKIMTTKDDFSVVNMCDSSNIYVLAGNKFSITYRISILEDTTITPETFVYEKFTGGQPSPNLDYPSEVKVVEGKNRLDASTLEQGGFNYHTGLEWESDVMLKSQNFKAKANKEYTFSCNESIGEFAFICFDNSNNSLDGGRILTSNKYVTFITKENTSYIKIRFGDTTYPKVFGTDYNAMLEEGSIVTKYLSYNTIEMKVSNKNFLPFNNQDFIIPNKGIHFYCKDGNLYVDGASIGETSSTTIEFKTYFSFYLYPGIYYLSKGTYKEPIYLRKYDDNSELIVNEGQITIYKKTLVYLGLYIYQQTFSNTMLPIRLEKLPVATTYIPHQEQNYPLSLGDLWLGKIGKYEDYFYKENNEWYLHKKIRHLPLKISDMNNSETHPGWKRLDDIKNDFPNKNELLANFSTFVSNISNNDKLIGINTADLANGGILFLSKIVMNLTQTEWKEKYPDLVLDLYYGLQNGYDIKITDTTLLKQLDDLENALSYQGQTNISQDADVPFRISASASYDLNNLIDRVAVLETV